MHEIHGKMLSKGGATYDKYAYDNEKLKLGRELLQDSLDLIIPYSMMGMSNINAGLVGIVGTITSLIGIWNTWS
jgi:peroxin-11B